MLGIVLGDGGFAFGGFALLYDLVWCLGDPFCESVDSEDVLVECCWASCGVSF